MPVAALDPYIKNLKVDYENKRSLWYIYSKIKDDKQKNVTFEIADQLLCEAGNPALAWRDPALEFYYWEGKVPPDPTKPVKCAAEDCDEWFSVEPYKTHKRFCSDNCQHRDWAYRAGLRRSISERKKTCKRGHDLTVHLNKFGRCAACKKITARKRRKGTPRGRPRKQQRSPQQGSALAS